MSKPDTSKPLQSGASVTSTGLRSMSQFLLTALFALTISFLTFAASFAEVPRSQYAPTLATSE